MHFISSKGAFQVLIHIYLIVTTFKGFDKIIGELNIKMANQTFESKKGMLPCGKILQNDELNES